MLKKLFSKKIGKNDFERKKKEMQERIAKMDVYSMYHYLSEENSCEMGIEEIIKRLITKDADSKRRFLEISDSKFKIEKTFELIIEILEHNNVTKKILTLCEKFVYTYSDVISENDEKNKRIYEERLNHALFFATKKFSDENEPDKTE